MLTWYLYQLGFGMGWIAGQAATAGAGSWAYQHKHDSTIPLLSSVLPRQGKRQFMIISDALRYEGGSSELQGKSTGQAFCRQAH